MAAEEQGVCPYCKERIDPEATRCPSCGSRTAPTAPGHDGTCPYCKEAVHPQAVVCKHCRSDLRRDAGARGHGGCGCGCGCGCGPGGGHGRGLPRSAEATPADLAGFLDFLKRSTETDAAPAAGPEAGPAARASRCTSWCWGSTLMCACPVNIPGIGPSLLIYACGTCIDDPVLTAVTASGTHSSPREHGGCC
ncbi:double zinc ribbon domain-containing protein [Streptomyces hydrogenans]|uniref:double zinc ribbon domain-containing protein n=1 Tax=Streptomyces hydrogenans TaxID=1873719 RepID=UPI00167D7C98|nr:zinc ribbon domain-containing protein [Streptomyces hydrogenans]GHE25435.1 hypothetical protein GCM10018784_74070 [Streptomyces hydrogenans]